MTLNIQTPIARRTDPLASHVAEQAMNKSGKRKTQMDRALDLVTRFPNRTASELADASNATATPMTQLQLVRRLADLNDAKLVERTDKKIRKCNVTGAMAHTWHLRTPKQGELL